MCRRFDVRAYQAETVRWNVRKFINVAAATGRHSIEEPSSSMRTPMPAAVPTPSSRPPPTGTVAEAVELVDRQ